MAYFTQAEYMRICIRYTPHTHDMHSMIGSNIILNTCYRV